MKRFFSSISMLCVCILVGCASNEPKKAPLGTELVTFPSSNGRVNLYGYWMKAEGVNKPTIVVLHGGAGLWREDSIGSLYQNASAKFVIAGWNVLLVDSMRPRSYNGYAAQFRFSPEARRVDAIGAVNWLRKRSDIDTSKIALVGYSHGGGTALSAVNSNAKEYAKVSAVLAYYPTCYACLGITSARVREAVNDYDTKTPTLILSGAEDNVTPAVFCEKLTKQLKEKNRPVNHIIYQGAGHGFTSRVRLKTIDMNSFYEGQNRRVGGSGIIAAKSSSDGINFLKQVFSQ